MSVPQIPSRRNQDPAHVMDLPSLNMGYKPCSKKNLTLVDLDVTVYGADEIAGNTRPVSVILIAHGWANTAAQMENMAHGLIGEIRKLSGPNPSRDVVVCTVDQRNHGTRKLKKDTLSYNKNPWRLVAMTCTLTGGVEDQQLIMRYLEDYLYPMGERRIAEFMVTGVSLGGHVAWRLMKAEPSVRVAVPIIAVPADSLGNVHTARFRADGTLGTDKMYYPRATKDFYETPSPPGTYAGRKIYALCGGVDQVIPPAMGQTEWEKIVKELGPENAQQWIQPGRGHICTPEMVAKAAEWFYKWGVENVQNEPTAKL